MRPVMLAALLTLGVAAGVSGQEPPDTVATEEPDRPPAPRPRRLPPDSLAALQDTTLQKLRERTPLFPEDIDPYTPLGLGTPALTLQREDLKGWPAVTLAELLPWLYPLALDDQGGPGFFQEIRFPSGTAASTQLLIDGRPAESPLGPGADLRTIPLAVLERIEIRPGTAAVPGGAEAGWINLVTRTHLTPQANSVLPFDLGSFGREGFGASLSRWLGSRLSFFAALSFDDSETFTRAASAERSQFWGKLRFYLSRTQFVEASYGTSGSTTDTGRTVPVEPSPFAGVEDRRERRFQALYRGRIGPALASARFYADRFEEREGFTLEGESQVPGEFDRRGARGSVRLELGRGSAEAGLEWQEEDLESESELFSVQEDTTGGGDESRFTAPVSRIALFAGADQAFDSLSVAAHARIERFDTGAGSVSEPALALEARYAAPRGFTPYLRMARSARHPSFLEQALLAGAGAARVPIASARELRAGSSWSRAGYAAELTGFLRRGSDAAVWLPPTGWRAAGGDESVRAGFADSEDFLPGEFADLNLLDLRARGLELRFAAPLPFGVRGEAFARLQSVEDGEGASIPYIAREQALGRLTYEERFFPSGNLRVRASLGTRVTGARDTRSGEELPAYASLDGLLRVQLIGFTLGLAGQNLLDVRYRTEERFRLPGRVIAFEVSWEFWN